MIPTQAGMLLVQAGAITREQLEQAMAYQQRHRDLGLSQAVAALGFASEGQLLAAQAAALGLQVADSGTLEPSMDALAKIPYTLATRYDLLPLRLDGELLTVAVNDAANPDTVEQLRRLTGLTLRFVLCERAALRRAIHRHYSDAGARLAALSAAKFPEVQSSPPEETVMMNGDAGEPAVIRLLDNLIQHAASVGASDLHIEPSAGGAAVRLRVDGALLDYLTLGAGIHPSLVARVKLLAGLDIADRRRPQDGHFRARLPDRQVLDLRVAILPTVHGEKAVLRLLGGAAAVERSGQFGMDAETYARFLPLLQRPGGLLYLTGPTGCGKTTTLYMILQRLAARQTNIATIEDPVERTLPRVNQTQVNPSAGLTFEAGLRALLRQDPDILMVGETRDAETAAIAVRAAITGHMVFSTLHTNDALSAVVRLRDMGVPPYLIAASLNAVLAQRLLRRVCPYCGEQTASTEAERGLLRADLPKIRRGRGCPRCRGTGYLGRIAIHELVVVDPPLRQLIAAGAGQAELAAGARRTQPLRSLWESALALVREGLTTPEEMLRTVWPE